MKGPQRKMKPSISQIKGYWQTSANKTSCMSSPSILLNVFEVLGDESKVLAHLQPKIRLWYPAIVGMDGMVLGQLPGNKPARLKTEKIEEFGLRSKFF